MKKSALGLLAVLAVGSAAAIGIITSNEHNNNTQAVTNNTLVLEETMGITSENTSTNTDGYTVRKS